MASELRFDRTIQADPPAVYRMFTSSVGLREWLCDQALADARPGGSFFLVWNNGFFATGQYSLLQPNSQIDLTWRGKNDPETSQVHVLIDAQEGSPGSTMLNIVHSGLGEGGSWDGVRQEIESGWQTALENLTSVLEQGHDLRIVNRPLLGVLLNEYTPEAAELLNVPVRQGVRLNGVIDGLSAQKAGLQKDDVIVEVGGKSLSNASDIGSILQGKRAGDRVEVVYYRGPDKHVAEMELARRPLPDLPLDAEGLAQAVERNNQEDYAELLKVLQDVSEEEASFRPAESEWSVKEVLAHLIQNERSIQYLMVGHILDRTSSADEFPDNVTAAVRATAEVYGSLAALLEAFQRAQAETVALLRRLPPEFVKRRSSMWMTAYARLTFPLHVRQHAEQIQALIQAARESKAA